MPPVAMALAAPSLRCVHAAARLRHAPESLVVPTPSARERSSGSGGFGRKGFSLQYRGTSLMVSGLQYRGISRNREGEIGSVCERERERKRASGCV